MQRDLRNTAEYREAEALYRALRQPGTGRIVDAAEVHVSSDGNDAVFAATLVDALEGAPPTRIARIDLVSGDTRVLTFGPNVDRLPRFSPDDRHIAFLSDRHRTGDFQLYLLDPLSGAARATPRVEGWVESLSWSPDGTRILLGVAGHGADLAGGQIANPPTVGELPSWMPAVEMRDDLYQWRRAWVYEVATDRVRQVSGADSNIWDVVWCGNDALAAVVSPSPGEGFWYSAHLNRIDLETGKSTEVYAPRDQLGAPAASPSGRHLAVVEALCSDRGYVAGELRLIDTTSGKIGRVETQGVDVTGVEWRSDRLALLAGHRGDETVVGVLDPLSGTFTPVWRSREISTGGRYACVSGLNATGDCVLVGEGFRRAPEIALIRDGNYRPVKSFEPGEADRFTALAAAERVDWNAPDGLEIQGWLLRPKGVEPHPLVMIMHGGPVWHWRPLWLGRWGALVPMLIERGYALFLPNPRGSSGRGQDFARRVVGDMGGADTEDCLSGLDHLVAQGIADARRLGVIGVSYGGFMTAWLITQDSRFAAAVPVAPITNQVSGHLISNIPHFFALFLADRYTNPGGRYFERSPIMHAHKVRTPTLSICGTRDRCTPPAEARQFHHALLEHGVESVLVEYPEEAHGVRNVPAAVDYAARVVRWFETHMPAASDSSPKGSA